MSDIGCPDPTAGEANEAAVKAVVVGLHVADGVPLDDAAPFAEVLEPPARARRSREGEQLFVLFSPAGVDLPQLCRELREIVRQTYWSTSGSVTAALRRSVSVVNRYLFEHNLGADRSDRWYGGLACAVLRGRDVFLLQAGPVWACVLQEQQLRCFPHGEKLAHMGIGPIADVRLNHVFAAPGDTLLLAPYTLLRDASEVGLRRTLSLENVDSIAAGLTQVTSNDFAILIARWESPAERQAPQIEAHPQERRSEAPSLPTREALRRPESRKRDKQESWLAERRFPKHDAPTSDRLPAREGRIPFKKAGLDVESRLRSGWRHLSNVLSHMWHGVAAVGAGVVALGRWLLGAVATTIRGTLPGSQRAIDQHTRRHPAPKENRAVMMAIAIGIPVVVLVLVLVAYRGFAAASRFQGVINQAMEQIALAQAAGADSEEARAHWEQALQQIEIAIALQPEDPATQALRDQVREALDQLDSIQRLTLTQLIDFGSSSTERRLALTDQTLFVLDAAEGWVTEVPVNREGSQPEDGRDAGQGRAALVRTGQQVDGDDVGRLVDCAWLGREGGRQSSALLVLEERRRLISYDPAWRTEGGAPQLTRLELNSPPPGRAVAVGSYRGQFYVMDATAEDAGQIWRYRPEGDAYPNQPERYFAMPPARSLEEALDMAIDGHIYILYVDGTVAKFLGGEPQGFQIQGVPGGLGEVIGFAVDPDGDGSVYLADRDNARIVAIGPDGSFKKQFRVRGAFGALEALAVNQAARRLYVLDEGQLFVASLP